MLSKPSLKLNTINWYPMRVPYSREIKLKDYLDTKGIKNYVPMYPKIIENDGKAETVFLPMIHNIIFIHTSSNDMKKLKGEVESFLPMRYIMNRDHSPIIVPIKQMDDFIRVVNSKQKIEYVPCDELLMRKGEKVRIIAGIFEGVEGTFIRLKGNKTVVVSIDGILAVSVAYIPSKFIEVIQ